jgi:multiple antibiotic resistance protein
MLSEDIRQFSGALLLIIAALLPIVNPVASAPVFLSMTHGADSRTREALAARIAINAGLLLFLSMVIGSFVLKIFDLSVPVVEVAGGAVLCRLGWELLHSDAPTQSNTTDPEAAAETRSFYPLTMPVTVDPGVIAVAIAIGANHGHALANPAIGYFAAVAAVCVIGLCVWLTYRYAERVALWLGHTRMMALLRLCAFIVLCIGVQIMWTGTRALLTEVWPAESHGHPANAPFRR